ncbi:MAG: hypothetical protein KJ737_12860 [Proteobacteria bacterium]|nr:hypothetical protein [Pseudomonadota bacterium]
MSRGISNYLYVPYFFFLSEVVQLEQGCCDKKAEKKYVYHLKKRAAKAEAQGRFIHPLIILGRTISRISSQFIRVVRNHFYSQKPLRLIIPLFVQRLEAYL